MEMTLQHEYTTYDELREFLIDSVFGMENIPDVMTVQMSEDSARGFNEHMKDRLSEELEKTPGFVKTYNRTLKIEVI